VRVSEAGTATPGSAAGWRLVVDPPGDGAWNMAADEAMAVAVGSGQAPPTLRLYGWARPTVSLGFLQRATVGVNREACQRLAVPVVRRLTGGRAVLHDAELTYSVALPLAGPWGALGVAGSFAALNAGLLAMLRRLGVEATVGHPGTGGTEHSDAGLCFLARRMPAILAGGRKLIGSAQRRAGPWLLQHGSLLTALDDALHRALFPSWPGGSRAGVTSLEELLGRRPSFEELVGAMAAAWTERWGPCRPEPLSPPERARAERLAESRYREAGWTWQR
jgi:lipoate-protein ligase A